MVVLADLVIQFPDCLGFTERRKKRARVRLQGRAGQDRLIKGLLSALAIDEEKQFVLDECAAEVAAVLTSLEIRSRPAWQIGIERVVTEAVISLAVVRIRPGLGDHIERTG